MSSSPVADFVPDQSSLATQDLGLLVTVHLRWVLLPIFTEAGCAVRVTTGLFVPVVPPTPVAVPPPGNAAALFSVVFDDCKLSVGDTIP